MILAFLRTLHGALRRRLALLALQGLPALLLALGLGTAGPTLARQDFLDPAQAFRLSVRLQDSRTVVLHYDIAPGYYLYRERFAMEGAPGTVKLGEALYPPGRVKFDETFQKDVETYHDRVEVRLPVEAAPAHFKLTVTNQGCAEKGLCYPPQPRHLDVRLSDAGLASVTLMPDADGEAWAPADGPAAALGPVRVVAQAASGDAREGGNPIEQALQSGRAWRIAGVFLLAGVLLAFTPCVLPMLPILSSIIVGDAAHGRPVSRWRGLSLSVAYSLGMALVYTAMGVGAGLAGEGLAAALQTPWVLAAFAGLLVVLSLSMFGFYELQLPSAWQSALSERSQRLQGGRYTGVFLMGGLSALIVGPCVAAPLAGALVYISQTRDVVLGGTALFSLAVGMSVPLVLLGLSAGSLLPRAGAWMEGVKRVFGVMLLGVAVWMVGPILPTLVSMLLWGGLAALAGALLWRGPGRAHRPLVAWTGRVLAGLVLTAGLVESVGALSGGRDMLRPWAHWRPGAAARAEALLPFRTIKSVADLDAIVASADRPVLLDFYADWCVSCKEMEQFTFPDPRVQAKFAGAILLRADVTANDTQDKALLRRFGLFGPPGLLFFDANGQERMTARVIGYQSADDFLESLARGGL